VRSEAQAGPVARRLRRLAFEPLRPWQVAAAKQALRSLQAVQGAPGAPGARGGGDDDDDANGSKDAQLLGALVRVEHPPFEPLDLPARPRAPAAGLAPGARADGAAGREGGRRC